MLGHQSGFVALYRADAMPLKPCLFAQGHDFFNTLGNVVFTKCPLSVADGVKYRVGRKCFGHSQKTHVVWLASCCKASGGDAITHALKISHNHGHNSTVNCKLNDFV